MKQVFFEEELVKSFNFLEETSRSKLADGKN